MCVCSSPLPKRSQSRPLHAMHGCQSGTYIDYFSNISVGRRGENRENERHAHRLTKRRVPNCQLTSRKGLIRLRLTIISTVIKQRRDFCEVTWFGKKSNSRTCDQIHLKSYSHIRTCTERKPLEARHVTALKISSSHVFKEGLNLLSVGAFF